MADTSSSSKSFMSSMTGRLLLCSLGSSLLALIVYSLTLAGYIFPGESASLFTQWMGLDSLRIPSHPLWGGLVKAFGEGTFLSSMPLRLNLISLVCGVLSAGILCYLTGFLVYGIVRNELAVKVSKGAAVAGGLVTSFVFIFSTAIWQSSTHLEYRIFDVCYALVLFLLFVPYIRFHKIMPCMAVLIGLGVGIGFAESVIFIPLFPLYLFCLVMATIKNSKKFYLPTSIFLIVSFLTFIFYIRSVYGDFLALPEAAAGGYETVTDVFATVAREYMREIRFWFTRSGWLYVIVLAVLPFIASTFASVRGLNNEKTWRQYLFHIAITLIAILATATALSPESVMRPFGISPVATSTLVAVYCGYLAAYWYLLARTELPQKEYSKLETVVTVGRKMAPVVGGGFAVILALAALINAFNCKQDRGEFADICAKEIVDRLGSRTWLVTDGMLDAHIRAVAATCGKEVNLICLQRDMDNAYLKEFAALIRKKDLKSSTANLAMSIELGVLPFLQDWFSGDKDVMNKVAIFGVPDFWFMGERQPVPECMFFGGVEDVKKLDGKKAKADFLAFWEKIDPVLHVSSKKGSYELMKIKDPVARFRMQLRRHVGFIANNLGVMLQDLGMHEDAFEIYELVLNKIDCDNVCALFNEFEMVRAGIKVAMAKKADIERQLRDIVDDPKRRYMMWSLSRYYGYIRSPEIFARMGYSWAISGQTGSAIAQVQRAIEFVPQDRRAGLLNMMAAIYANDNQTQKSKEVYQKVLEKDGSNREALIGMTRLALQRGSLEDAKNFLTKAVNANKNSKTSGFDWALLHLMNNNLTGARLSLQKVTDIQPKSLQAWSLLAGVLLRQLDEAKTDAQKKKIMEELEAVILPKMESIAESPRDYYVQLTRALVLMRKGKPFLKQARDALVVASMARPDMSVAGDMILNIDISLDDAENAEKHARQILRNNRHDKLANYVMGSIRLKEGDYLTAEEFLRISVNTEKPLAAAQNDLAEVLRRLQKFDEAEKVARATVKNDPELYVAWETLGSSLLDQNKNLDEAEQCVKKAIQLAKEKNKVEDIRMQITLARVQIARGDMGRARGTLRTLRSRQEELSKYDQEVVDKLMNEMQKK